VPAIDGPFIWIDDAEALAASATRAAELGFDAKWAIHPSQLAPIEQAFIPSTAEVEHAHAVIEALANAGGVGAVRVDGEMVDEPVRLAALRVLARAGVAP
jgi:citrate lyase subunit beta/citryl-CoA lyase